LVGCFPFREKNPDTTRDNICQCKYEWPEGKSFQISAEAKEVISKMLVIPAQDRGTPDEIVKLPFFSQGGYLKCSHSNLLSLNGNCQCHRQDADRSVYEDYCQRLGIGYQANGDPWPCVEEKEPMNPIRKGTGYYALPWAWGY
jgi:hypothetical protein